MNTKKEVKNMLLVEIRKWILTNLFLPTMGMNKWIIEIDCMTWTFTIDKIIRGIDENSPAFKEFYSLARNERKGVLYDLRHMLADELMKDYVLYIIFDGEFTSPFAEKRFTGSKHLKELDFPYGTRSRCQPEAATTMQIEELIHLATLDHLPRFRVDALERIISRNGFEILKVEASALIDSIENRKELPYWAVDYQEPIIKLSKV